jgi:hypothetical protein
MGNFFTREDPVKEKQKIKEFIISHQPIMARCPQTDWDPALDFEYNVTKTRIIKIGEKCPKGTGEYNRNGGYIECLAGGVTDTTQRDASFSKIKECVKKQRVSTYVPEPYEKNW